MPLTNKDPTTNVQTYTHTGPFTAVMLVVLINAYNGILILITDLVSSLMVSGENHSCQPFAAINFDCPGTCSLDSCTGPMNGSCPDHPVVMVGMHGPVPFQNGDVSIVIGAIIDLWSSNKPSP